YYFDVPKNLKEGRFPTRWDLYRVAPWNPVYIRAIWGYWRHTLPLVSVANSEALRRAGITRETVPPWEGVTIEKDTRGEPTGVFVEQTYVPLVELSLMAGAPATPSSAWRGSSPKGIRLPTTRCARARCRTQAGPASPTTRRCRALRSGRCCSRPRGARSGSRAWGPTSSTCTRR